MCWIVPPATTIMKMDKIAKKMIKLREMPPSGSAGGAFMMVFYGSSCYCGPTSTKFLLDTSNLCLASAMLVSMAKQTKYRHLVLNGFDP